MFNVLIPVTPLFLLTLFSFFILFTIRQSFIKRKIFIFLYHICLFCILFIASVGGGDIQNDGYNRLEKFILLEKSNELELAKQNLQKYDPMLQIDLKYYKNSSEFKDDLKSKDTSVDKAEAIFIGWLFVLISEISMCLIQIFGYILFRRDNN